MDRRDRHGRGMRGPLAVPPVPIAATRREEFEDLVEDAAEKVDELLRDERDTGLHGVRFVVEEFPVFGPGQEPDVVPFGRVEDASAAHGPTIVVYRRTIELRTDVGEERAELVHDAVVELIAEMLGADPDDIDPGFDD